MTKRKAAGKGPAFERLLCKRLSKWVSGTDDEDLFWRSAISGGRATQAAKGGKALNRQAGDICSISAEGHALTKKYFIEAKHYKDLDIQSFVLKGTGKLARFWSKACMEAARHHKEPLLIAKQNNLPALVVMCPNGLACNPVAVLGRRAEICFLEEFLEVPFNEFLWGEGDESDQA